MSKAGKRRDTSRIDLSRPEQWVVHHVMLREVEDRYDDGESPPWWAVDVIETLEEGPTAGETATLDRPFTCYEAWRVRRALAEYAEAPSTPDEDAAIAVNVVKRLDETFVEPPTKLQ